MKWPGLLTAFIAIQVLTWMAIRQFAGTDHPSLTWFLVLSVLLTGALLVWFERRSNRETQIIVRMADEFAERRYQLDQKAGPLSAQGQTIMRAIARMATSTEHHHREQAERIAQMESMLAGMIEGVIVTDNDGFVLLANDAAAEMFSRPGNELIGRRLLDMVRYISLRTAVEEVQLTGTPRTTELETFTKPRRLIVANIAALNAPSRGGLAIVLHDVTEVRRLETMRRDFVANVSHELKTPLSVIKACAETLLMGALHDDQANTGFVRQIENQAEMLDQQVQRLLELSQAQSGQAVIDIQPVDLNGTCCQVVNSFLAEAEKRQVALATDTNGALIVNTDEDAVHTMLNNLISNALRYTPPGGNVVVRTRIESTRAIIDVADTGIGVAPDDQERIFERFYRVDKARSRDQGGTGLGLAIVKHRVQSLGGSVELVSQIGKGSTFRVLLPVNDATNP